MALGLRFRAAHECKKSIREGRSRTSLGVGGGEVIERAGADVLDKDQVEMCVSTFVHRRSISVSSFVVMVLSVSPICLKPEVISCCSLCCPGVVAL